MAKVENYYLVHFPISSWTCASLLGLVLISGKDRCKKREGLLIDRQEGPPSI